ncbi:MAG: hypothetical protein M1834_003878 [Cirrosporium novae-zelandiae]|nr:MAG: hypothetical protein M1834_003878 [Cirrosporium novae-zelandiae]
MEQQEIIASEPMHPNKIHTDNPISVDSNRDHQDEQGQQKNTINRADKIQKWGAIGVEGIEENDFVNDEWRSESIPREVTLAQAGTSQDLQVILRESFMKYDVLNASPSIGSINELAATHETDVVQSSNTSPNLSLQIPNVAQHVFENGSSSSSLVSPLEQLSSSTSVSSQGTSNHTPKTSMSSIDSAIFSPTSAKRVAPWSQLFFQADKNLKNKSAVLKKKWKERTAKPLRALGIASNKKLWSTQNVPITVGTAHHLPAENGSSQKRSTNCAAISDVLIASLQFAQFAVVKLIQATKIARKILGSTPHWKKQNVKVGEDVSVVEPSYVCGATWHTCACTQDDLYNRNGRLLEQRMERQREQIQEQAEIAAAIQQVEAVERRERLQQERDDRHRRREVEAEAQRQEAQAARREAERRRNIVERVKQVRAEWAKLKITQRDMMEYRHSHERDSWARDVNSSRLRFEAHMKLKVASTRHEQYKALKQQKAKHEESIKALIARHELEQDDYYLGVRTYLRDAPNREQREERMMDKVRKAHSLEKDLELQTQKAELEAMKTTHNMAAEEMEARMNMDREDDKMREMQRKWEIGRGIWADRHWFDLLSQEREEMMDSLEEQLLEEGNATAEVVAIALRLLEREGDRGVPHQDDEIQPAPLTPALPSSSPTIEAEDEEIGSAAISIPRRSTRYVEVEYTNGATVMIQL